MRNKIKTTASKKLSRKGKCQHHWIIETPKGPISRGVCKYCGAAKEFQNFWRGSLWERDTSKLLELPRVPSIEPDELDDC